MRTTTTKVKRVRFKERHPYQIASNWLPGGRLCFWENDQMNSDRSKVILEERHWEKFRGIIK